MSVEIPANFDWNIDSDSQYPIPKHISVPTVSQLSNITLDDESPRDGLQGTPETPTKEQMHDYVDLVATTKIECVCLGIATQKGSIPDRLTMDILKYSRDNQSQIIPVILARPIRSDLEYAVNCALINPNTQIIVFKGLSPIRTWGEGWQADEVITDIAYGVSFLEKRGIPTIAFTEDTSRIPPNILETFVHAAVDAGAPRVGIANTIGVLDPVGAYRLTHAIREMLDKYGAPNVGIDYHDHRDRELAIANILYGAIPAGADRIHATWYGVGERSGNAPLEIVMYNINRLTKEAGGKVKWNLTSVQEICRLYEAMSGVPIPAHTPIVGENAFRTQAGIHAAIYRKLYELIESGHCDEQLIKNRMQTIYTAIPPSEIDRELEFQIGPFSGVANVLLVLNKLGYSTDLNNKNDPRIQQLLDAVKQKNEGRGGILSPEDIISTIGPPPNS